LAGHSFAGLTLSRAGEAIPELISRIVYMSAVMPAPGKSLFDYIAVPEFSASKIPPLLIGDPQATGALRLDFLSADPAYQAEIKAAIAADVDDQERQAVTSLLSPDVPAGWVAEPVPITAGRRGSIPHLHQLHRGLHHPGRRTQTVHRRGRQAHARQPHRRPGNDNQPLPVLVRTRTARPHLAPALTDSPKAGPDEVPPGQARAARTAIPAISRPAVHATVLAVSVLLPSYFALAAILVAGGAIDPGRRTHDRTAVQEGHCDRVATHSGVYRSADIAAACQG
jgi:hypothetical protein